MGVGAEWAVVKGGGPMRKRALLRAAGQGHFLPHCLYSEHFVQCFVVLAHTLVCGLAVNLDNYLTKEFRTILFKKAMEYGL